MNKLAISEEFLAKRLRELRRSLGLQQKEMAGRAGISGAYLSELEGGKKKNPSLDIVERIASEFSVSLEWLVGSQSQSQSMGPVVQESAPEYNAPSSTEPRLLDVLASPAVQDVYSEQEILLAEMTARVIQLKLSNPKRRREWRNEIVEKLDKFVAFCDENCSKIKPALLAEARRRNP